MDEGPGARRCSPRSPTRRRLPAPSDARPLIRTEHLLETSRAPNTRGPPSPGDRGSPQRDRQLRPSRPPNAYGSFPSTPLRSPTQRGRLFGSARAVTVHRRSCASAHASFLHISVIGSPRSSDSSPVASERRRSTPPHPLRRPLSVPSTPRSWRLGPRLSSCGLSSPVVSQAASHSPPRPTNARCPRTTLATRPPPQPRRRGRELPSPVANPKAAGLVPFWRRRERAPSPRELSSRA
mgnify:CR=1 FL=1